MRKRKLSTKKKRDEEKNNKVNERLEKIENNLQENKERCERRESKLKEQKERTVAFKTVVGLQVEDEEVEIVSEKKAKTWSELIAENQEAEAKRRERMKQEDLVKMKTWHKKIKVTMKDTEKGKEAEKEKKEIEKEVKLDKARRDLGIGDKEHSQNEEDWSWNESDRDWEGTEERLETEKRKKINRYRRRKHLEEETATKAKHMIGLGPVTRISVDYFNTATADWELAKNLAVKEYLSEYLQFEEEEIREFDIIDTLLSSKNEDIIYVTFAEYDTIKDIHKRVAEIQNDDINIRNYVPPQYWDRYTHLGKYCQELRTKDNDVKTLLRFSNTDIKVLTKNRIQEDYYRIIPMEDIERISPIPKFNHTITWKKRSDRPAKKQPEPVRNKVCPPSMKQSDLMRQRSIEGSTTQKPSKRQKQDDVEENMSL